MRAQSNILLVLKHAAFTVMFLGIIFQSSAQTISLVFNIEIVNNNFDSEEEQEEEQERSEKELKDEKIELNISNISFQNIKPKRSNPNFKTINTILDFTLEIHIPPPENA